MDKLLALLPYLSKAERKFGKVQGRIIYAVLAVFVVLVIRWLIKQGLSKISDLIADARDENELQDAMGGIIDSPQDGVIPTGNEIATFREQARFIADQQENAMRGCGTTEEALFSPLISLNGWQLAMVAEEFGMRNYEPCAFWELSDNLNLFGWYLRELSDNSLTGMIYDNEGVDGCTSYVNQCTELMFMRAIWSRAGNNLF